MAVVTVNADDVTVTFNNTTAQNVVAELVIRGVKDKREDTSTINVTYRDVFEIEISKVYGRVKDGKIDIIIYRCYDNKPIERWIDKKAGDVIKIDTAKLNMKPAIYYIAIRYIDKNSESTVILRSYTNVTPSNDRFNLSVDPTEYEKPIIEYDVKNRGNIVAIGDNLTFKVTVWGTNYFEWYFKRWSDKRGNESYRNLTWGNASGSYNYVSETIKVNTFKLFNNTTLNAQPGEYEIIIEAAGTKVSFTVKIEKPMITANVDKSAVVPGGSIKISGVTNLARTGDADFDANGSNKVYILVYNTADLALMILDIM